MKSLKSAFLLIIMVCLEHSFAQKVLNDATITYRISVQALGGKTEQVKPMDGATLTIYLRGNQSRSDMVSALGTESSLFETKSGNGYILKEYSGQKLMITMDRANWSQKNKFYHNANFTLENKEQNIGGFKAKTANSLLPDGKALTVYYSSDYIAGNKQYNNAFSQLPGIPVQYEVVSGNLKFSYHLIKLDQEIVPASQFEIPKTGYRVMTYAENQQLKKGENK